MTLLAAVADLPRFEIRALATRDSLAGLTQLLHRAYAPLVARGMNLNVGMQDERQTRERTLTGQTFVALHGRQIVATLTVCSPLEVNPGTASDLFPQYRERNCCRFHQFAVDPDWAGHGLARLMVKEAEDWALARGYRAMAMDMAEGATELCGFYRHMGYRGVGVVSMPGKTYRSQVFRKELHPSPLRAPLLTMARHHRWCTRHLLAVLAQLSDADYMRPAAPGLASIHDTLAAHLAREQQQGWARIVNDTAPRAGVAALLQLDRQQLAQQMQACADGWCDFIDGLPEDRLHGQLRRLEGELEPDLLTMADALMQVFWQASHCGGELGTMARLRGLSVPPLGLLGMLREESAP